VIVIEEDLGRKDKLKAFDCDYNNYGTALRAQPPGAVFDSIEPRESEGYLRERKGITPQVRRSSTTTNTGGR